MPHKKGHKNTPKQQEKYNMLADRLADSLVSQDPNATKYMKFSGDQTHLMSGPTFLNRHPELAKKYGMTGQPMHMLVKQGKAPTLDAKPMNKIPIDEVAMELKGKRIPLHTKKQQPKSEPDIQYVTGYDRIRAVIPSVPAEGNFTKVDFYWRTY